MIEAISDYFKGVIRTIDSDLGFDGFVFDTEYTADHNLDYTYKLEIGSMKINRPDTMIESTVPVTVKIYRVSSIDRQEEDFLKTYCKAIDITSLAMNQTNVSQADYIKSVVASDIMPQALKSNDNSMQFTLKFKITVSYKYIIQ